MNETSLLCVLSAGARQLEAAQIQLRVCEAPCLIYNGKICRIDCIWLTALCVFINWIQWRSQDFVLWGWLKIFKTRAKQAQACYTAPCLRISDIFT